MPHITRVTCPPGSLTTSSLSLWIYCNSHSPLAPLSREPQEPVASGIGKWENKRKFIPDHCGQECAFTALREAGKRLASCLHLIAEGVCISGLPTLRKLQTARGRDHSCSEASTIIFWVSLFLAVFPERKRSLWNTEFKLILPFYTLWIIPDKPAKRYALLLSRFQHFQQNKKGHRTFILRPISLRG